MRARTHWGRASKMDVVDLTGEQQAHLDSLARYMWWRLPDGSPHPSVRLLAQVMDIGTWEDLCRIEATFDTETLAGVLAVAQPGWFRPQSWSYWHYRLGIIPTNEEPPPPPRRGFYDERRSAL